MANPPSVEVAGLRKSYGNTRVLDGVDLSIAPGSVFALLGPNGTGKTTTVRILSTLTRADGGSARVAGFDVVRDRHHVRQAISLSGQYTAVDEQLTGLENLRMMGKLSGLSRNDVRWRARELLEQFDLEKAASRRVATYSGGMRRRLDLAASLVTRPLVLFLDEPTTGLDPRSRQAMWEVVTDCARTGVTVFLTTQYLEEADRLADHIAVMNSGRIVAEGTAASLKSQLAGHRLDLVLADHASYEKTQYALGRRAVHRDPAERLVGIPTDGSAAHIRSLLDEVDPSRTAVSSFALHTATLDDVFLALTTRSPSATPARQPLTTAQ